MRVLQTICTSGPGGAETVVANLSKGLLDRGIDITVVGFGDDAHLYDRLDTYGVKSVRLKNSRLVGKIRSLLDVIKKHDIDLIHAHMFDANLPSALAAVGCGVPFVLTVHSTVYETESWKRRLIYSILSRLNGRIACVSISIKRSILKCGVNPENTLVIYNGVDIKEFGHTDSGSQIRRDLAVGEDSPLIGMIANVRPAKDHAGFIASASKVVETFPNARIILAGDNASDENAALAGRVAQKGLGDHIHLLGLRNDIPALLAAMDIFVLASHIEGLPISVIEAMASGLPVIASNVGGVPELVNDMRTGYLVRPGDSDELAARIISLLENGPQANEFGKAGRIRAESLFSIDSMCNGYASLYNMCLGKDCEELHEWRQRSGLSPD